MATDLINTQCEGMEHQTWNKEHCELSCCTGTCLTWLYHEVEGCYHSSNSCTVMWQGIGGADGWNGATSEPLIVPACTDSPNWADNWGSSCQIYIDHGRCIDGAITTMQTREEMSGWATGVPVAPNTESSDLAPYDACCACGRGVAK